MEGNHEKRRNDAVYHRASRNAEWKSVIGYNGYR